MMIYQNPKTVAAAIKINGAHAVRRAHRIPDHVWREAVAMVDTRRQIKAERWATAVQSNEVFRAIKGRRKWERTARSYGFSVRHKTWKDRTIARICIAHGVSRKEIFGQSRSPHVVNARQCAQYWLYRLGKAYGFEWPSIPAIGRFFGRDHTTVLHSIRTWPKKRAKQGRHLRDLSTFALRKEQ